MLDAGFKDESGGQQRIEIHYLFEPDVVGALLCERGLSTSGHLDPRSDEIKAHCFVKDWCLLDYQVSQTCAKVRRS